MVRDSLRAIAEEGRGVLVYLHETGPGFRVERNQLGEARLASHNREFSHYQGIAGQSQFTFTLDP